MGIQAKFEPRYSASLEEEAAEQAGYHAGLWGDDDKETAVEKFKRRAGNVSKTVVAFFTLAWLRGRQAREQQAENEM